MIEMSGTCTKVETVVRGTMPREPTTQEHGALGIFQILHGSGKSRIGSLPDPECTRELIEIISKFMERNAPIEMLVMWGATKGYSLDQSRREVDLADLLGLSRFAVMGRAVQKIYPPGMKIRIIDEDVGERSLSTRGQAALAEDIAIYATGLRNLARVLGGGVTVELESELLTSVGRTLEAFQELAREWGRMFRAYWDSTDGEQDPDVHASRKTYQDLVQETGWKGFLLPDQRDFRIQRAWSAYPDLPRESVVDLCCQYFANLLVRNRFGVVRGSIDIPPIRGGFIPPVGSNRGRITYKVKDSKGTNTTPPWSGFGFVEEDSVSVIGVRFSSRVLCEPHSIHMSGISLRADVVLERLPEPGLAG